MKNELVKPIIKMRTCLNGSVTAQITASRYFKLVKLTVKKSGNLITEQVREVNASSFFECVFNIENPVLWSLSSPELYDYSAEMVFLDGEKECV